MHESFAQAALREAREELSIVIPADSLLELGRYTKPDIPTPDLIKSVLLSFSRNLVAQYD